MTREGVYARFHCVALGEVTPECHQVGVLESRAENDDEPPGAQLVDQVARLDQSHRVMQRRVHRGENERCLRQPRRERARKQERMS